MSDENGDQQTTELDLLKARARMMGITFSNNIGLESLKARVNAFLERNDQGTDEDEDEQEDPETSNQSDHEETTEEINPLVNQDAKGSNPSPKPAKKMTAREQILADNMKLVRLRITNMDPKKKDLPGEVITVANELLGTVRKYVPFGETTDDGYHVPYCIYKFLRDKKFLMIRTTTDPRTRRTKTDTRWMKEYALEVLPNLTQEELNRLATAQAAAGVFSSDDEAIQ